ncbi:MAG: peptidase C39 family protein, partial [Pseudohongiellaceae bacterium]
TQDIKQQEIEKHMNQGGAVIMLISTYRMDGKKSPHWVTITGMDDQCFYLHDPDPSYATQIEMDCQHIPIARSDFVKMSSFGRQKLRTAVLISNGEKSIPGKP